MPITLKIIFISVLTFFWADSRAQQIYFPPLTGSEWNVSSPESLGWCTGKIDSLYQFLDSNNTKAFLVLKDGNIVLEKYFGSFNADSLWYWASAGKTLTALLTGIAREEGYLAFDSSVSTYLGQGWTSCPPDKEYFIKVKNQLTMTSGLDDMVNDPDCTLASCLQYSSDAGSRWAYHNAPYSLLNLVISNSTSTDFNTYFNTRIRNKTGMNGFWLNVGYNHVYFSNARSMARFGLLLLAKGNWATVPILHDTAYFREMTNTSQNLNKSYGYLTWLNGKESYMLPQSQFVFPGPLCPDAPADMFAAMGKNGQLVNVVPSQGLVMVRMGNQPDAQFEIPNVFNNLIWQYLNSIICASNQIAETENEIAGFNVFPNPVTNEIHIKPLCNSGEYQSYLYNSGGQLILRADNINKINVADVPDGAYVLLIVQNETISRHAISIIH